MVVDVAHFALLTQKMISSIFKIIHTRQENKFNDIQMLFGSSDIGFVVEESDTLS